MLRILRKKMRGILIATIVLIIPAFIGFYGVGRYRGRQSRTAVVAKVNGQKIDYRQFHDAYQGVKRRWQSLYRNHWDEQMEGQLKKEALEELIREILLPREAKRRRIVVTDQEVFDQISSIPGLHKEGKFDKALYLRVLSYKGLSPERFEAQMREDLMVKKLRSQVTEEVEISEEELKEEYIKRNEKVRVKYILFKKEDFKKDLKMEEKELKDYLQENLEEFKVPEKVNVQYVLIDPREREIDIEIDEDEISSYYQENIEDFKHLEEEGEAHTVPLEEVRSQIQATLKAKRADEVAREEAEDLAGELLDKTDWERMVKEKKLEVRETGLFANGEAVKGIGWTPQFSREAFAVDDDEVSQAIKTPRGYAIFVRKKREKSHLPELEEVREKVEEKVKDKKATKLAKSKAEECLAKLREGGDLEKVAEDFSVEVEDSGLFSRGQYIEGIGPSRDFGEASFSLKEAEVSDSIETRLGFCLLQLEERKEIDEEKYNKEKEKFKKSLLPWKKMEAYHKWYESLRSEARVWIK